MPDHAGFAVAITVRARALNDSFRRAYVLNEYEPGRNVNPHTIVRQQANLPLVPFPRVSFRLFFQPPEVTFAQSPVDHATLRVTGWGSVTVRMNPFPAQAETRDIQWEARLVARHEAEATSSAVHIRFKRENYQMFLWQFDILSGTHFSPDAAAYLNGDEFKAIFQELLRQKIGDLGFPISISFFGRIPAPELLTVTTRSVAGALMVGINAPIAGAGDGSPVLLRDFAGGNDIALYVNNHVIPLMLLDAQQEVANEIAAAGATLEGNLEITTEEGRFRVRGRASRSEGSANFSFAIVRQMVHTRPGKALFTLKGPMTVKSRIWPALSFRATDPSVDIQRASWVVLVEALGDIITLGGATVLVEIFLSGLAKSIGSDITSAKVTRGGPIPLVRRSADPVVRTAIEAFDIHADGVFVGITSQLKTKPALLSGMKRVPRNFAARPLRYDVRLPFGAVHDDPFLRIRWTAIDLESGSVLVNEDGIALDRLSFRFNPGSFGVQSNRFAVVCRVYRTLGPFVTELLNETFKLDIGPPIQPGAFVRWRYDVRNPQVSFNEKSEEYAYVGESVVRRWSKFHRTDKPCNTALEQSRYTYEREVRDDLPFPIHDMVGNRHRLCDYCFFGGPGSGSATL